MSETRVALGELHKEILALAKRWFELDSCLDAILWACPNANYERLRRHIMSCEDMRGRTAYMLSEAHLGHHVPLLV